MFIRLLLSLLITCSAVAQVTPPNKLDFQYDFAGFKGQDGYIYLEIYVSVTMDKLSYVKSENKYAAAFMTNAKLFKQDSLVIDRSWNSINHVDSLRKEGNNQKLFVVNYVNILPGDYRMVLEMKDNNSGLSQTKETVISLLPFNDNDLMLSDIELSAKITPSTENSPYYKNGYHVIPNTDRLYGTGLPMMMFYYEIYNLKKAGEPDSSKYMIDYRILNGDQQVVRKLSPTLKKKPGNSAVEIGGLNIIALRSGTYFLQVDVNDTMNNRSNSKRIKFFVYRQGEVIKQDTTQAPLAQLQAAKAMETIYDTMTGEEIDNEFAAASYLASNEEKKIYKTLDLKGKKQFMPQFWTKRDETPESPRNEFRENFLARMEWAKEKMPGFRNNWKSDEGRVLLMYGIPDDIERFPSSQEVKSYQIWHFHSIQGGVQFIFIDKQGWGKYELVHSTARGELQDYDWERWLN
jgi:GWxTD domain-containing protein